MHNILENECPKQNDISVEYWRLIIGKDIMCLSQITRALNCNIYLSPNKIPRNSVILDTPVINNYRKILKG